MTWTEHRLDELGYVSRGRSRHRPRDHTSLYGGNYPFIQTGDVKHSQFYIRSYTQTYNEKGLAQSRLWSAGTLCITIAANIADTAILSFDACFPDSIIGFIANPHICDVRYIKYFFDTVQTRYKQIAQGAAQDNLSLQKLLTFPIVTPPLTTQQRIADILSTYDRLIDNNNRRIALLEESIHQLYKEWFVRLRFPGYESVKVVDGIPEGWNRKTLKDIALSIRQSIHPSNTEPNTPYVGLEHIPRQSIALTSWGYSNQVDSNKFVFTKSDILFGKIRPYFHKVVVAPVDGICSSDAIVIRPINQDLFGLTLSLVSSVAFVDYTSKTSKEGSKMPRANWDVMEEYPILIPSPKLLQEFNSLVSLVTNQITNLIFTNQHLRQARDLLLPRLMNGSITV